jgi:hypothetical protein
MWNCFVLSIIYHGEGKGRVAGGTVSPTEVPFNLVKTIFTHNDGWGGGRRRRTFGRFRSRECRLGS